MSVSLAPSALPSSMLRPLGVLELVDLTQHVAAEVAAGAYPFVRHRDGRRWHQRLYRDRRVDVWLISWLPTHATRLHDHGGSSGAFTVVSGELTETIAQAASGRLTDRLRPAGESVGFGARYVHDVRNAADRPALSVHAYSAPLTSMTYYDVVPSGLRAVVSVETDDPEAEAPGPHAAELVR